MVDCWRPAVRTLPRARGTPPRLCETCRVSTCGLPTVVTRSASRTAAGPAPEHARTRSEQTGGAAQHSGFLPNVFIFNRGGHSPIPWRLLPQLCLPLEVTEEAAARSGDCIVQCECRDDEELDGVLALDVVTVPRGLAPARRLSLRTGSDPAPAWRRGRRCQPR